MRVFIPFYILLFSFLGFHSFSQNLTFDPDTLLQGDAQLDIYTEFIINMYDQEDDTLHLSWRMVGNTLPEEWTYDLCDFGTCYTDIPNTGDMAPIFGEDNGLLKLILNPNYVPGEGIISFWVYETGHIDEHTTVHFHISAGLSQVKNLPENSFEFFPNPAKGSMTILNKNSFNLHYSIQNLNSQPLINGILLNGEQKSIDLSELPNGFYLLNLRDEKYSTTKKFMKLK